jgi:hypothetical protein
MIKKTVLFVGLAFLINCFNPFGPGEEPCDDCMHFAMNICLIHSKDSSKIVNIKEILLDQNGTRRVLDTGDFHYGVNIDSVYRVSASAGTYDVYIVNFNNDTIRLKSITINKNKCNVLTKNMTLSVDSTWIRPNTLLKSAKNIQPLNTNITENYHCG